MHRLDIASRTAFVGVLLACGCGDDVQEAELPHDTSTSSGGEESVGVVSEDDAEETSGVVSLDGSTSGDETTTTTSTTTSTSTSDDGGTESSTSGGDTSESSTGSSSTGDSSTGDSSTGDSSTGDTSTGDTSTGDTSTGDTSTGDSGTGDSSTSDGSSSSSGGEESTGEPEPQPIFVEDFDRSDGSPWPAPWAAISQAVIASDVTGGMGRLAGAMGFVGRMAIPGFAVVDVDVTLVIVFDDPDHQGAGFYVRQNGGALHETDPEGEGYEIYLEGDVDPSLSVWREVAGNEFMVASIADPIAMGLEPGVPYAMRFQCVQAGGITELRAKAWPADEAEPAAWMLETTDASPSLQGAAGSFAFDIYNYFGTNSVYVDDIVVTAP